MRERERGGEKTESGQSPDAARAQVCHRLYGERHDTGINVPPYRYRYNMQMRWCTHTWGEPASRTVRNNTPVSNTCCSGRGRRRHRERRDHRSRSVQLTVDFCFRSEDLYSEAGPAVIFLACLALPPPCFATRPYSSLSLSLFHARVRVVLSRDRNEIGELNGEGVNLCIAIDSLIRDKRFSDNPLSINETKKYNSIEVQLFVKYIFWYHFILSFQCFMCFTENIVILLFFIIIIL